MTLLTVVQDVCEVVGVVQPTSVFSSIGGNRTMQEMLALANEMAQRIAYDSRDWQMFKLTQTMAGDGVTAAFPLPANYKRMLLTSNIWRSNTPLTPMRFVPDTDEWIRRRLQNWIDSRGEWTLLGGQVNIVPVMGTGITAMYGYLHKNCITLAGGGLGATFIADGDSTVLDERLLKLGMIWQWKANKGSPYNEDMATFEDAMAMTMGHDSPAPIIIDRKPASVATKTAYPFLVPTS
jgi:hypothetical protein